MQLREFASDILPEVVYVFNTSSPHSQALLYYAKEYNPAVTRFYVEDGIEAYRSDHSKTESTTTYYLERLLYGHWYQQVYVFGLSERVDRILVSHPEKIRNELKNKPIEKIDFEPILHNHQFIYGYLDRLNARASLEAAAIVLLPLSNQFDDDQYSGALSDAVQIMIADGIAVGVKYHPRETNPEYFDRIIDGSVEIPDSLPIELLYLANRDKIQYVFGEFSTALITARNILDDAVVKSTPISHKEQDESKTDIMRKFGISTVEEVSLSTECE